MNQEFAPSVEDLNSLKWDDLLSMYVSHLGSVLQAADGPREDKEALRVAFYACVLVANLQHAENRGEFLKNLKYNKAFKTMLEAASEVNLEKAE